VFILVGLVLLLLLPSPWNIVAFVACFLFSIGEVLFWNRTVRRRRAETGADTLIGKRGLVVSECRPGGQVRVDGEIWDARCDAGADRGEAVLVTGRSGLSLDVEPISASS
jgi:membrane-bound serine protease (ClpP class)